MSTETQLRHQNKISTRNSCLLRNNVCTADLSETEDLSFFQQPRPFQVSRDLNVFEKRNQLAFCMLLVIHVPHAQGQLNETQETHQGYQAVFWLAVCVLRVAEAGIFFCGGLAQDFATTRKKTEREPPFASFLHKNWQNRRRLGNTESSCEYQFMGKVSLNIFDDEGVHCLYVRKLNGKCLEESYVQW